jgi:hypothetical protein
MRIFLVLTLLASIVFSFQNCGETARTVGLFADEYSDFNSLTHCQTPECRNSAEMLWMRIREYEPYKVNHETAVTLRYISVGGQCGIGFFPNHYFEWTLREGFGAQNLVAAGSADNICDMGQFQLPILLDPARLPIVDRRYQLTVELIGINDNFQQVTNPQPANNATLDILFSN